MLVEANYENTFQKYEDSIDELMDLNNESLNEANTRSRIIDKIFCDILKWENRNINREEHISGLYIDYVFESNKSKFLVEAKKNGKYFYVPVTNKKINIYKNFSSDEDTKNAINQAVKYCNEKGLSIGCITNGSQIIAFNTNLNTKYNGLVFNGFEDIKKHFLLFYNIFSPYAETKKSINEILSDENNYIRDVPQYQNKVSNILDNPNERINRNPINQYLGRVIDEYFSDITINSDKKVFEELYCSDKNIPNYDKRLLNYFYDHLPKLEVPVLPDDQFEQGFNFKRKQMNDALTTKSDVMLIIGGAGVGKTTFIYRFFNYILNEKVKENIVWLNINLLEEGSETFNVKEFILKSCLKEIRSKYSDFKIDEYEVLKEIYATEIGRMKNGSLKRLYESNQTKYEEMISEFLFEKQSNESEFALSALKYIGNKTLFKKTICITVDNADQKNINIQIECFKTVYDLSLKFNCLIILSLREETYWKLKDVKPFDAYSSSAYHISAPKINEAILRRIKAASKNNGKTEISIENNGKNVVIEMSKFLDIVSASLFRDERHPNYRVFRDLSTNNLRYALNLFTTFLTSGHTNTNEYINIYLTSGEYFIPNHAIIRSLALGDFKYYRSEYNNIGNLLKFSNDGFFSHFTKLKILESLDVCIGMSSSYGKGFITTSSLYSKMHYLFNNDNSFYDVLLELIERRLIETDFGFENPKGSKYIRLTSAGHYYFNELIYKFAYLERIVEDTTIKSREYFTEIEDLTNKIIFQESNQIGKSYIVPSRTERVKKFIEYLEDEEKKDNMFLSNSGFAFNFVEKIKKEFEDEQLRIYGLKNTTNNI